MSYGALRYTHASPEGGIQRSSWGWRNGRLWIGCHACGVPRELAPVGTHVDTRGQVVALHALHPQREAVACDRAGCGVEVRLVLGGWTDLDTDQWRRLVTGKGDGDV